MALANAAMLIYLLWPAKIIEGMVRRPPQRESLLPDTGWMKDLAWCVINLRLRVFCWLTPQRITKGELAVNTFHYGTQFITQSTDASKLSLH